MGKEFDILFEFNIVKDLMTDGNPGLRDSWIGLFRENPIPYAKTTLYYGEGMQIEIEYCDTWNYLPRATSLAAELKEKYGVEAILVSSDGGVFEVKVDENLVFSKKQSGRFPEDHEVPDKINAL